MQARHIFVVLLAGGCGYPTLADIAGRRIEHPLRSGTFEAGALVVDSQRAALRVVLELDIEAPLPDDPVGPRTPVPALGLGRSRCVMPVRVIRDRPVCLPQSLPLMRRPWLIEPPGADPSRLVFDPRACFAVIRAEYEVPASALPLDSLAVLYGARRLPVRWRSP